MINMNDINEIKSLCAYISENEISISSLIDESIRDLKAELEYVINKHKEKGNNCLEITFNTDYSYTKTIDNINKETALKEIEEARAEGIKSIKLNGENISNEHDIVGNLKDEYFTEAYIELYKKYSDKFLCDIEKTLKSVFGFEITSDNGTLNFEMSGCGYNIYLSRGYICLEEEDNSTIENIYNVESVSELVDLIKDLKEDA